MVHPQLGVHIRMRMRQPVFEITSGTAGCCQHGNGEEGEAPEQPLEHKLERVRPAELHFGLAVVALLQCKALVPSLSSTLLAKAIGFVQPQADPLFVNVQAGLGEHIQRIKHSNLLLLQKGCFRTMRRL